MWIVYFTDGDVISSDDRTWSEVSERVTICGADFDILHHPAIEILVRHSPHANWHRLRAPTSTGERFFLYLRGRFSLTGKEAQVKYIAAGFFLPVEHGRIVLEVAPGWSTTRVEYGTFTF